MKLFLTSSCISENLQQPFLEIYGKDPRNSRCYFIPTATDPDKEKFYTCKSMDDLAQMGFNPIWYTLKYKNKEIIQKELADADIVWVGGGNTFYLLGMARKTGFLEVIDDLVKNKGVAYGGVSAGTILAASNIEVAGWEPGGDSNDAGISDLKSTRWVNFIPVVHFDKAEHEDIVARYKKPEETVLAIPDGSMVVINGEDIKTFGNVEKYSA